MTTRSATTGSPERSARARGPDVADLVARARDGQARAVARLISLVEDASPQLRDVAAALAPHAGNAQVIGLTGPPGVGKSTSTAALISAYREAGHRVGVLAIDPSSPFSGGALLGDRIRMQVHATDPNVFIRSMATRGHLGGLSWAAPQALRVLDAAGYDIVLIETVGVGQSEVEVVSLADTTLVLLAPGMGDGIQAAKAGILEIADVFVVNKADRDGADQTARELKYMISLGRRELHGPSWRPPVVRTIADKGHGVSDVIEAIGAHRDWMVAHGELERRRIHRARTEVEAIALHTLRERLGHLSGSSALAALSARVMAGELDPYAAADELVASLSPTPQTPRPGVL
ncbi:MAG: methylmalonyl Co-A mutase-associated GTPase MeaB [Mycobacteriaceae bacterium]